MPNLNDAERNQIVEMVRKHKLSFVPSGIAPYPISVNVNKSHRMLGHITVNRLGVLIEDINNQPDIELVLDYIRKCLVEYRDAYAGCEEGKGAKLYLLYEAGYENKRKF